MHIPLALQLTQGVLKTTLGFCFSLCTWMNSLSSVSEFPSSLFSVSSMVSAMESLLSKCLSEEIKGPVCPMDFPGGSEGKVSAYNVGDWVWSLGWEDLLGKEMATHSSTLGKFHGWRSLVGYSPWGHKELDTTERLQCQCHVSYCLTSFTETFQIEYKASEWNRTFEITPELC